MSVQVVLTAGAKADVLEAATWYSERSARASDGFLVAIRDAMSRIAALPTAQPVVDHETSVRRVIVRRFPYRVLYVLGDQKAIVLAVVHTRRDDESWKSRLR